MNKVDKKNSVKFGECPVPLREMHCLKICAQKQMQCIHKTTETHFLIVAFDVQ